MIYVKLNNNTVRPDQSVRPEPFVRAQDKLRVAKSKEAKSKGDLMQAMAIKPITMKEG